jgi:hypothetical protein
MSRDDIETFEARYEDKTLFQNIGLLSLGGAVPLGLEKIADYYWKGGASTDAAILLICIVFTIVGGVCLGISHARKQKIETFKERLFKEERKLSSSYTMTSTPSQPTAHVGV